MKLFEKLFDKPETIDDTTAMKRIAKHFATLAEAERFHESLYGRFDSVKLVKSPLFEAGIYIWEVK